MPRLEPLEPRCFQKRRVAAVDSSPALQGRDKTVLYGDAPRSDAMNARRPGVSPRR